MMRTHRKCDGYIDARPCPYDATQLTTGDKRPVCRIHLTTVHLFRKHRPPPYSWAEPGKATEPFRFGQRDPLLNMYGSCQICSKAAKVVFFSCGEHRCCTECAGAVEKDPVCPICLSLKDY